MAPSPRNIVLKTLPQPQCWEHIPSTPLTDSTLAARKAALLQRMQAHNLKSLVVYADKEHGGNFEYLTGFIPRFEEALLVLHSNGEAVLVLGNENLKLAAHARLENRTVTAPWFSLPNQPMTGAESLTEQLRQAGLPQDSAIGIAGWKLFSGPGSEKMFDIPAFILDAIRDATGKKVSLVNATGLFINPNGGARTINNANELAHYEYGANLASTAVLKALNAIDIGKTEKQIGGLLAAEGQAHNVISIAATGDRFASADLYPSDKVIRLGDKFSLTASYKGGLTSRAAYVVAQQSELAPQVADYLEKVAIPYYKAVVTWLENLRIGMTGGELYQLVETVLPKAEHHWHLNPGHLVADEEWLCSPVMPGSAIQLQSGMIFQIDIIPSHAGYAGASIEDTVALADEALRQQIAAEYPALWARIEARRDYIQHQLGIRLPQAVLPFSNSVGYLRPWLLDKHSALVFE